MKIKIILYACLNFKHKGLPFFASFLSLKFDTSVLLVTRATLSSSFICFPSWYMNSVSIDLTFMKFKPAFASVNDAAFHPVNGYIRLVTYMAFQIVSLSNSVYMNGVFAMAA